VPFEVLRINPILIKNFFGRWKSLFGIVHGTYRGGLRYLRRIIRSTVLMTNSYIAGHRAVAKLAELANAPIYSLEHRFTCQSFPALPLTPENLRFRSVRQALEDISVFIKPILAKNRR
jgi:hypothetical protein